MAREPAAQDFKQIDQWHKKGKKLAAGGMFSKKNPDDAEKLFDQARNALRKMRPQTFESVSRLIVILEDTANAQSDMTLNNQAAKSMEDAARTIVNNKKIDRNNELLNKAPYFYQQSSMYYLVNSQYEKSAKMLVLAANLTAELGDYNEKSLDEAIKLYDQACGVEETENRYQMAAEFFDAAIKFCINNNKFNPANDFLRRQIKMWENDGRTYYKRIFSNICSLMVIQFHLKNVKNAQNIYNQAVAEYQNLNEYCGQQKLCEQLLLAFETADEAALDKIQKSGDLGVLLMNTLARLAKRLNMVDIQPTILTVVDNNNTNEEQKINDPVTDQIRDEAKDDVADEQLVSTAKDTAVDEDGAPDLFS